jgi:ribonuclease HI
MAVTRSGVPANSKRTISSDVNGCVSYLTNATHAAVSKMLAYRNFEKTGFSENRLIKKNQAVNCSKFASVAQGEIVTKPILFSYLYNQHLINVIEIFTDGAAQGNPGPGGYGVVMRYNKHEKELSGGYRLTTNNRMELLAVIAALEAIKTKGIPVKIVTDSQYVARSINEGWIWNWEKKNFKDKANVDLWKRYIPLHKIYNPKLVWVRGHAGHAENERCDLLAVEAANGGKLKVDVEYEAIVK